MTIMLFESSKQWQPEGRQNLITALTSLPPGWVSAPKRQCMMAFMAV